MSSANQISRSDLIKDRKEKVRRQAGKIRNEGLKQIKRQCKEKKNSGQVPEDAELGPVANLFSSEEWETIGAYALDPSTPSNILETCMFLQTVRDKASGPSRSLDVVLPLVLQVPDFQQAVGFQSLLNLRTVSKQWRDIVDQALDKDVLEHSEQMTYMGSSSMLWLRWPQPYPNAPSASEIINLCNDQANPYAPRLLNRSLGIDINWDEVIADVDPDPQPFIESVSRVISALGSQLWHFEFRENEIELPEDTPNPKGDHVRTYRILQGWISKMPQLTSLALHLDLGKDEDKAFKKIVKKNPFPNLKNLTSLKLDTDNHYSDLSLHVPWLDPIVTQNKHIKHIDIGRMKHRDEFGLCYFLKMLRLESMPIYWNSCMNDVLAFKKIPHTLKKVHLELYSCGVPVTELFGILNTFKTLENVSLKISVKNLNGVFLKMPCSLFQLLSSQPTRTVRKNYFRPLIFFCVNNAHLCI